MTRELLDIESAIPDVQLDIRYATANNFTGKQIYDKPFARLAPEPLKALAAAAEIFRKDGLVIVVFDAWRPEWAQAKLREVCSDDSYVSEFPRHASGYIIDMTLATQDGPKLDMGTDYDDFSEKAHVNSDSITSFQKSNRRYMHDIMRSEGFEPLPEEWWDLSYDRL